MNFHPDSRQPKSLDASAVKMKYRQIICFVIGILFLSACQAGSILPESTLAAGSITPTIAPTPSINPETSSTPTLQPTQTYLPASTDTRTPTSTAEIQAEPLQFYITEDSLVWDPSSHWLAYTTSDGRVWLQAKNDEVAMAIPGIRVPPPVRLYPIWSPVGDSLLVYGAWGSEYPRWTAMWLVPVDSNGAGQAQEIVSPIRPEPPVFQNEGIIYAASWASDGRRIAYSYQGEAWLYDRESGKSEQVTQIIAKPLIRDGQFEPFDGVREIAFSPRSDYLAIGLTCNCPSPFSGVATVNLTNRETQFIEAGRLTGWSPDGGMLIFEIVSGDWDAAYTFDIYGADPASGEITNLTQSNPGHDPITDSWDPLKLAVYQTREIHWASGGEYLYITLDYHLPFAPALGFIIRQDPQNIILEKMASANSWYIFPAWLPDSQVGYIEAEPGHPESANYTDNVFEVRRIVYGQKSQESTNQFITNAVWTPDGSALALVVVVEPGLPDKVIQILPLN